MNNSIICLETSQVFESVKIATEQTPRGSKIKDAVGGRQRVAGGYHWCRVTDLPENYEQEDLLNKISQIDLNFGYVDGRKVNRGKRVRNLDTGEEFYSASDAALHYRLASDAVAACCRGVNKTAGGCRWEYVDK